ncbi:MAG TPA: hypothetical protein VMU05_24075 [Dongiaceae bacterium]|nr:hypothetical protein [Dongiaceae bacterium]
MNVVFRIRGGLLIVIALQDEFHTVFHPARQGNISDWIAHAVWRALRRLSPRKLTFAGPMAFVLIVAYWTASIIIGFALIYLPELPQSFVFARGLDSAGSSGFPGALNVSVGGLITLSTGIYSNRPWLGLLLGLESIVGFALLTASVSWILSIYPILEHRRSLAHEATLLHFSEVNGIRRLADLSDTDVNTILLGLASQVSTSRHELMQFPITYYFYESEAKSALAGILPYIAEIAEQNLKRKGGAGLAAAVLGGAVDDYLKWIAGKYLKRNFSSRYGILQAFAEDQLREPVHPPQPVSRAA